MGRGVSLGRGEFWALGFERLFFLVASTLVSCHANECVCV